MVCGLTLLTITPLEVSEIKFWLKLLDEYLFIDNNDTTMSGLFHNIFKGISFDVVANRLQCEILVRAFELILSCYHIYPTPPLGQDLTQGQFISAEFNRFEFRVFLLLD